jgi:RNA-directed DNA polymerase
VLKRYPLAQSRLFGLQSKKRLAGLLGVDLQVLRKLAARTDNYRVFPIQQNNGKTRVVEEPKPEMKQLHSRLADLLSRIEPPPYLHSGTKGRSYVTNAKAHIARGAVIKTDLSKFYPSTTHHHVFVGVLREFKCSGDVAKLIADLCTHGGHVPTGSPVSMLITFYSHKQILDELHRRMEAQGIKLTVYVDDLTMSGEQLNLSHLCPVKKSFRAVGLSCHKTRVFPRHSPKLITGAIVTEQGLLLPNRRHRSIGEGIRRLSEASSHEELQTISRKILGQINEAAVIEERSKQRLPGLKGLIHRLSNRGRSTAFQMPSANRRRPGSCFEEL